MTQEQLANKLFVSQATVAKLEGDVLGEVQDQMIERLSNALEFPLGFFLQQGERMGFGSSAYFYRKREKISAADRKRISSTVNLIRLGLARYLSMVDLQASRKLPFYDVDEFGSAPLIATTIRNYWSLPDGPIKNLTSLIESAGVVIIPCDFGTRHFDATSLNLNNLPPLIFINRDLSGDRWRFTLAHELGHLVMHDTPRETMEDEADSFASELLMPSDEIKPQFSRIGKVRLQELINIKPYWKVSVAALIMRASSLGFLSKNQSRYLWMQMSKAGYRLKEPNELERESVNNYPNLFAYFRSKLDLNEIDLAKITNINPLDFELLHEGGWRNGQPRRLQVVQL